MKCEEEIEDHRAEKGDNERDENGCPFRMLLWESDGC